MAQTLTEIRKLLDDFGLRPKKRYGQNFLHDGNMMRKIIHAAQIRPGELVLEVGPGTGALTGRILNEGADVIAVEVDQDFEPLLRCQFSTYSDSLWLIFEDILSSKHQLNTNVMDLIGSRPFKLIANLPYSVASPLLANLAAYFTNMSVALVMVQQEVAERLTSQPRSKNYGPLGIMIQAMCDVQRITTLPPSCFWPVPKVNSALIKLTRRPNPLTNQPHRLESGLQTLFSKRRKQLGSILRYHESWPEEISPRMRPEELTVQQIISLFCCTED